jgi:hypothetical protein
MVAVSTRSGSSRFSPLLLLFHPFYAIALLTNQGNRIKEN